jgi:hypothetical protein
MNDQIATTSQTGSTTHPHSETLQPAVVDYVLHVIAVDNPLGLKALQHQTIYQVWKVLVAHGEVVQVLGLMSSSLMDERYRIN